MDSVYQALLLLGVGYILITLTQGPPVLHKPKEMASFETQYHLKRAPSSTFSKQWQNQTNAHQLKGILRKLLKKHKFNVLCMHHIREMDYPYQACMVTNRRTKQDYFLLNPEMIGSTKKSVFLRQESISCETFYDSFRFQTVFVEWTDLHRRDRIYARFDERTAIELQIAMDEFSGSQHCWPRAKTREALPKREALPAYAWDDTSVDASKQNKWN